MPSDLYDPSSPRSNAQGSVPSQSRFTQPGTAGPNESLQASSQPAVRLSAPSDSFKREQEEASLVRHLRKRYDPAAMDLLRKLRNRR